MNSEEKAKTGMEQILERDHTIILGELKEMAIYVAIAGRKEFESQLLKLAQDVGDDQKRNAIYEVLVSLHTLWNQFQPVQGLQEKFRAAFAAADYKAAEEIYLKLARQGLDYIGTFKIEDGKVIPFVSEEVDMLLHFNKKKLTFYSLQLEPLKKITLPGSWEIIDVHVPISHQPGECKESEQEKTSQQKIMVLVENNDGNKAIAAIDVTNIQSKEIDRQNLEKRITLLDESLEDVLYLSCFQYQPLMVSKYNVYYRQETGNWATWYSTSHEITAFASTPEGFWVGHNTGDVFILKNLERVGVREVFKGFKEPIKNLLRTGRFVLIFCQNYLRVSDYRTNPVSEPIQTQCEIIQANTLNNDLLLLHTANGLLTARELIPKNIRWQLNLGDSYDLLFSLREYIYCGKKDGSIMMFEIPPFQTMARELGSKNRIVENLSIEIDPNAPIRYISDFIGRRDLLNEINEKYNDHFFIYGEPRLGKTSLLNVLRDALSDKARCCVIDMAQLLGEADSYETFERHFIDRCLAQHFMTVSDLPKPDGYHYQVLRTMIDKIKGTKSLCVFGLDNFSVQSQFNKEDCKKFDSFLKSLLALPDARVIITCCSKEKAEFLKYIDLLKESGKFTMIISREISLFSEGEVKNALRRKISLQHKVIDEIYRYTGRFPHLIHLFDQWKSGLLSIAEQSQIIAQKQCEKIFEYFRDLSPDARIFITSCLHENLAGGKVSYTTFYDKFPFLKTSLDKDLLEVALKEIEGYGSGLSIQKDKETFTISLSDNARLFQEAAKYIPWFKDFKALFEFTALPTQKRAHNAAQVFIKITQSELEFDEFLNKKINGYKDKFYVSKLTDKGMQTLKMPLTTFIVIPLQPWRKEFLADAFSDLHLEFQEFNRKGGEEGKQSIGPMFYILLFDLLGSSRKKIKEDLTGIERISIIDTAMMKDIILADSPQDKASQYIFDQLSIRERSPYTTAGAVPDSLFYGRQMELALIRGLPENIGIFGTRTIGKTSLLRRLHRHFQSQKQWRVYDLDCARIENEEALLKNLAEKMDVPFEQISDLEKFRRYVTREAEIGWHRYLFLLDEVDRLVQYDIDHDEKIFNNFNRLCNETMKNNETAARFILFGFQQMFEQMKNPLSRLYNFMVFLPLQALDPEGAMSLVTKPIENIRVNWHNKKDAEYLVDNCSRHPRLLQAACHALLTHLDSKGIKRDVIERNDVDKALTSQDFREICMRNYHDQSEDRYNGKAVDEEKKEEKKKGFFSRKYSKDTDNVQINSNAPPPPRKRKKNFLAIFIVLLSWPPYASFLKRARNILPSRTFKRN